MFSQAFQTSQSFHTCQIKDVRSIVTCYPMVSRTAQWMQRPVNQDLWVSWCGNGVVYDDLTERCRFRIEWNLKVRIWYVYIFSFSLGTWKAVKPFLFWSLWPKKRSNRIALPTNQLQNWQQNHIFSTFYWKRTLKAIIDLWKLLRTVKAVVTEKFGQGRLTQKSGFMAFQVIQYLFFGGLPVRFTVCPSGWMCAWKNHSYCEAPVYPISIAPYQAGLGTFTVTQNIQLWNMRQNGFSKKNRLHYKAI